MGPVEHDHDKADQSFSRWYNFFTVVSLQGQNYKRSICNLYYNSYNAFMANGVNFFFFYFFFLSLIDTVTLDWLIQQPVHFTN